MAETGMGDEFGLHLALVGGTAESNPFTERPYNDRQLERAWRVFGGDVMARASSREPGDKPWGYWRYELGVEEPATRLEGVLLLAERGLLTEAERERIKTDAERARRRERPVGRVISPRETAESMERSRRAREDEQIAIADALEAKDHARP